MVHKILKTGMAIKENVLKNNISSFAASTAFFLFLSLVPMIILICTIIPYTPLTEEILTKSITDFVPDKMEPLVLAILSEIYEKSAGILSVAALLTLWSAGKGMMALMRGLNEINGTEEKRNYFVTRLIASVYTLALLAVVVVSLLLSVFGNVVVQTIKGRLPGTEGVFTFLMSFRFLIVWVFMVVLFTAIYAYVPDKKLKFRKQIYGAVFSAVMWTILSWGFSLYVEIGGFSIYGSLAIIVLIMLFLYFCMYMTLIGAQINRYLNRETVKRVYKSV
ncbi:MAG: YihY/virulence factor BrkB family protein [Lachnospiraceae bacterium]|nr:YihY/virulence factor BrkB family protein [Lachnospiraceae bacterium]